MSSWHTERDDEEMMREIDSFRFDVWRERRAGWDALTKGGVWRAITGMEALREMGSMVYGDLFKVAMPIRITGVVWSVDWGRGEPDEMGNRGAGSARLELMAHYSRDKKCWDVMRRENGGCVMEGVEEMRGNEKPVDAFEKLVAEVLRGTHLNKVRFWILDCTKATDNLERGITEAQWVGVLEQAEDLRAEQKARESAEWAAYRSNLNNVSYF